MFLFKLSIFIGCLFLQGFAAPRITNSIQRIYSYALPNKTIRLEKNYDPTTGSAWISSPDYSIQTADELFRLEEADRMVYKQKYGSMHSSLISKFTKMTPSETIRVEILIYVV
jgi:hypothetical protein